MGGLVGGHAASLLAAAEVARKAKAMWIEHALAATVRSGSDMKDGAGVLPVTWQDLFLRYANVAASIDQEITGMMQRAVADKPTSDAPEAEGPAAGYRTMAHEHEVMKDALRAIARMYRNNPAHGDPIETARAKLNYLGIGWERRDDRLHHEDRHTWGGAFPAG